MLQHLDFDLRPLDQTSSYDREDALEIPFGDMA
jgi:hypothetical protein